jgi:hypothetical protein
MRTQGGEVERSSFYRIDLIKRAEPRHALRLRRIERLVTVLQSLSFTDAQVEGAKTQKGHQEQVVGEHWRMEPERSDVQLKRQASSRLSVVVQLVQGEEVGCTRLESAGYGRHKWHGPGARLQQCALPAREIDYRRSPYDEPVGASITQIHCSHDEIDVVGVAPGLSR